MINRESRRRGHLRIAVYLHMTATPNDNRRLPHILSRSSMFVCLLWSRLSNLTFVCNADSTYGINTLGEYMDRNAIKYRSTYTLLPPHWLKGDVGWVIGMTFDPSNLYWHLDVSLSRHSISLDSNFNLSSFINYHFLFNLINYTHLTTTMTTQNLVSPPSTTMTQSNNTELRRSPFIRPQRAYVGARYYR